MSRTIEPQRPPAAARGLETFFPRRAAARSGRLAVAEVWGRVGFGASMASVEETTMATEWSWQEDKPTTMDSWRSADLFCWRRLFESCFQRGFTLLGNPDLAMGQNPNRTPSEHQKISGWCTDPKMVPLVLTHSHMFFFGVARRLVFFGGRTLGEC